MKESAVHFVQKQIQLAPTRLKTQSTSIGGQAYPRRHIFLKLEKYVRDFLSRKSQQRWLLLPGLRGIGKTTVLSQLFLELTKNVDPLRVLYVSLDEAQLINLKLLDILEAYERIIGEPFETLEEPVFIFVDEVQYDSNWGLTLKTLYDKTKKAFVCCTGSSSVALQTNADVRRRVIVEKLFPLSFAEFQILSKGVFPPKGLKGQIKNAIYSSKSSRQAYDGLECLQTEVLQYWSQVNRLEVQKYLTCGSLPFALEIENNSSLFRAILDLLDKIVLKDIQNLKSFDQQTLRSIKNLLFILADSGDVLSVAKLKNLIGLSSNITVQSVLDVLEQAELLIKIPPFGSNKSKTTKPSKYLFMSPAIRMALLGITGKQATYHTNTGKFWEDAAALHFKMEIMNSGIGSVVYDPQEGGADFIAQIRNQTQIVFEIGAGEKSNKQALQTLHKTSADYGVTVSDTELEVDESKNILRLPFDYFLLM